MLRESQVWWGKPRQAISSVWSDPATFMGLLGLLCEFRTPGKMSKCFLDVLTEVVGKGKWIKKENELTILAIAWPLLYPIKVSTEKELQFSWKLEKTKEILALEWDD